MSEQNPFQAPESSIQSDKTVFHSEVRLASRWTRLGAVILDGLILAVFIVPIMIVLAISEGRSFASGMSELTVAGIVIGSLLVNLLINGYFLYKYQQTIGKRICKIKIVRKDFSKCSFARIFWLRIVVVNLIGQIPIAGGIFGLVDPLLIFRESHHCLHDDIADTVVIEAVD